MQRRSGKLVVVCALAAAYTVCSHSESSPSSGWHITNSATKSRYNIGVVTTITNTTDRARSAAFQIEDPECDPEEWYRWTWINITNGDGDTLFDGFSCDVLRFEVPAKQLLRVDIFTDNTSVLGMMLE